MNEFGDAGLAQSLRFGPILEKWRLLEFGFAHMRQRRNRRVYVADDRGPQSGNCVKIIVLLEHAHLHGIPGRLSREAATIAGSAGKRDGGVGGVDRLCDPGHYPGPAVGVQNAIVDIADNRGKDVAAQPLHHASCTPRSRFGGFREVTLSGDATRG
ncbi:hypothetical protein NKI20_17075 [Mesorhizobium sp. M0830]|uniref:hypothetical protein n=1 Tax=Mesorhizobium sp. M0830 TaxID=2957008 RepID=UPI00333AD702